MGRSGWLGRVESVSGSVDRVRSDRVGRVVGRWVGRVGLDRVGWSAGLSNFRSVGWSAFLRGWMGGRVYVCGWVGDWVCVWVGQCV